MQNKFSIILKNDLKEITRVSKFMENLGKEHNITSNVLYEIDLALEEIFTNIISYGFKDSLEHNILIEGFFQKNILIIRIEDDGIAFDPMTVPEPDIDGTIEERQIGGLGIYLTKAVMQNISYKREKKKNILVLEKVLE